MSLDRFTLFGLLVYKNLETTKFQAEFLYKIGIEVT